ncbi:MAG: hydrogenase maturation nickel metallochaperone HypA [Desulfovibrio sp.]|jgi:hydrogenase nickel incorporation protein HypA/HybF|nr:hydrogenase maturation nickel metallochaperone HypA [Desulfovibrio sp.]
MPVKIARACALSHIIEAKNRRLALNHGKFDHYPKTGAFDGATALGYISTMHEMALAQSLLSLAEEELLRCNRTRLVMARIEYGVLAGVMPEALRCCFEMLTRGTAHEQARLELVSLPLRLKCPLCGATFGGESREALVTPCPGCGELFGHIVEQGKEMILSRIEAA